MIQCGAMDCQKIVNLVQNRRWIHQSINIISFRCCGRFPTLHESRSWSDILDPALAIRLRRILDHAQAITFTEC